MDTLTQLDVWKMPGISNLPMSVRVPFGKAWFAEYNGKTDEAAEFLDAAVDAEKVILAQEKVVR